MPFVSPVNRARIIHHLGYGARAGIPAGDLARLEEAMNAVDSAYQLQTIDSILDTCDEYYAAWLSTPTDVINSVTSKELISGDINRAVIRTGNTLEARKILWRTYVELTEELAQQLWVPNYRQEYNLRYRFERSGGDFIATIPGVADTSVGGAHQEIARNGGGFGLPMY